jgi:hypothetical protein
MAVPPFVGIAFRAAGSWDTGHKKYTSPVSFFGIGYHSMNTSPVSTLYGLLYPTITRLESETSPSSAFRGRNIPFVQNPLPRTRRVSTGVNRS